MFETFFLFLANIKSRSRIFARIRPVLLRVGGMHVGSGCIFFGLLRIRPIGAFKRIFVASGTFMNEDIRFSCPGSSVSIGVNCLIGPRVSFECASHRLKCDGGGRRELIVEDIVVGDRVWIGAGVTVLGGSLIPDDVVIGACSLVKGELESGWLYAGVPARKVKMIDDGQLI